MQGMIRAAAKAVAVVAAALIQLAGCGSRMYTPDKPTQHITDLSGILTPAEVTALNAYLDDFAKRTEHCLTVFVLPSSKGELHGDFAHRLHNTWRIGRRGYDDGVILFVFTDDRVIRISVGYGLETAIPDKEAARIAHDVIRPLMLVHPAEALMTGAQAIMAAIGRHEGK